MPCVLDSAQQCAALVARLLICSDLALLCVLTDRVTRVCDLAGETNTHCVSCCPHVHQLQAFGILLHELITGLRAYGGVPIPLLPHEVAVKGVRPSWPSALPEEYQELQALAEACWQQGPQQQ